MNTTATKIPLGRALIAWQDIRQAITPDCERCEVAGSVRRGKHEVKDLMGIIRFAKNGPRYMAFDWLLNPTGPIRVDLFTATHENWPLIYMVRTGPSEFNMMILERARKMGYRILWGKGIYREEDIIEPVDREKPMVKTGAMAIPVASEADIFTLLDMEYIPPEGRGKT